MKEQQEQQPSIKEVIANEPRVHWMCVCPVCDQKHHFWRTRKTMLQETPVELEDGSELYPHVCWKCKITAKVPLHFSEIIRAQFISVN